MGISLNYPRWKNRNIIITNGVAIFWASIIILLMVIHSLSHPSERTVVYLAFIPVVTLISIPFLNKYGKIDIARTTLTFSLILGTLMFTISRKMTSIDLISMNTFYQSRTAILIFSIIPFAILHFSERKLLVFNLSVGFLGLALFDPLHNLFGVGFHQLGYTDPDYYYTSIIFLIVYMFLIVSVGFFKKTIDEYEQENETLIDRLHNNTILIENQKTKLENQGEVLKQLLEQKDNDLSKVTQELIKFNHDLLEYSYTISHNLRGPVARILGLINLIKKVDDPEKQIYFDHIISATRSLDDIIHDLNTIVETRVDSYETRERIVFEEEIDQVVKLLNSPIKSYGIKVSKDIQVSEMLIAKSRLNHVLFCLISNAIQFRRRDTRPEVNIRTYKKDMDVVVEIKDNGLGMDLTAIGDRLFKPFKRFHIEVSGKGINLFLVKLQVERLQGRIEVRSKPDRGTTFTIYLDNLVDEDL